MKTPIVLCAALVAAVALGGCHKISESLHGGQHAKGRYLGVGIYTPSDPWRRLQDAQQPNKASKTANDQAVIVVVDSNTGELRACGDLSGYCVGMNPWQKDLTGAQRAPVVLSPLRDGDAASDDTPTPAATVKP
ncbi:MAG TPA: hypothetical protein VGL66_00920 [Caulobacteraceae bacterium]|jgi:hypothetical protein